MLRFASKSFSCIVSYRIVVIVIVMVVVVISFLSQVEYNVYQRVDKYTNRTVEQTIRMEGQWKVDDRFDDRNARLQYKRNQDQANQSQPC